MNSETRKTAEQAADWINLVLGGLLFISPWVLGYTDHAIAPWHAWGGGIVVAVLAVAALTRFAEWEEWLETAIGVWLAISPWVLGFSVVAVAMGTHLVLGALIAVIAAARAWQAHTHAAA